MEIQNQALVSSLGVVVFGLIGAYGQWKQARLIWTAKSAQSVSVWWMATFLFMFLAYLVQGLHTEKIVMASQGGLRAAFYLPIIAGVITFQWKAITAKDFAFLLLLTAGIITMIAVDEWKSALFQVFGYLGVAMTLDQPYRIWKNKSKGRVSMTMLLTFTAAVLFWMWYALVYQDMYLFWLSLSFASVYSLTIGVWWIYRKS